MVQLNLPLNKKILTLCLAFTLTISAQAEEEVIKTNKVESITKKSYQVDTNIEKQPRIPSQYEQLLIIEVQKSGFDSDKVYNIITEGVNNNDPKLTTILGGMYATGTTVQESSDKAIELYKKSIDLGDEEAKIILGIFLLKSDKVSTEKTEELFLSYYTNHNEKRVEYIFGKAYYDNGKFEQAIKWLTKSANSGSDRSQFLLFKIFSDENNPYYNKDKYTLWLIKSANNGNVEALNTLYENINNGIIKVKHRDKALKILEELRGDNENNNYKPSKIVTKIENNQVSLEELLLKN